MSRLIVSVVGAAVGFVVGGPAGAKWGWMIGTVVGGAFGIGVESQHSEGPRSGDNQITASTLGTPMAVLYGTNRLGGNVIHASKIREVSKTEESGGKGGGGGVSTTTYSYNVDIAIDLCEGPVTGIKKIWSDGKLVYDMSEGTSVDGVITSKNRTASFKLYTGTETQMPDATLEAIDGVGNVPAYRGRAYIVFSNLDCFGGRIPQMTFEVTSAPATGFASPFYPMPTLGADEYPTQFFGGSYQLIYGAGKYFLTLQRSPAIVTSYDGKNWTRFDSIDLYEGLGCYEYGLNYQNEYVFIGAGGYGSYGAISGDGFNWTVYPVEAPDPVLPASIPGEGRTVMFYRSRQWFAFGGKGNMAITGDGETWSRSWQLFDLYQAAGGNHVLEYAQSPDTFVAVDIQGTGRVATSNGGLYWDLQDDVLDARGVAYGNGRFVIVGSHKTYVSTDSGSSWIEHVTPTGGGALEGGSNVVFVNGYFVTGSYSSIDGVDWTYHSGSTTPYYIVGVQGDAGYVAFGSDGFSTFVVNTDVYSDTATAGVAAVIVDQCRRAGLRPDQVDVSGITDELTGYVIARSSTARANIEPLLKGYFIDAVEIDGKLKFTKRADQVNVATILFDELAASDSATPSDPLPLSRVQDSELPRSVTVQYVDKNADYQPGAEQSIRQTAKFINDQAQDLPIATTSTHAKHVADVLLHDAWNARNTRNGKLSRKYAFLTPGDVVTIEYPRGEFRDRLITRLNDSGILIEFDTVDANADLYTIEPVGSTVTPGTKQVVSLDQSQTANMILDIPIIRDIDDNPGVYVSQTPVSLPWKGSDLYVGPSEATLAYSGTTTTKGTFGRALSILGPHFNGGIDESSSLTVDVGSSELNSSTRSAILTTLGNAFAIGRHGSWEIAQFIQAELVSPGVYTLSRFNRGLRGTEQFMNTHTASEQFVLLSNAGMLRHIYNVADLNYPRKYRSISIGLETSSNITSNTSAGVSLKPFSPTNLRTSRVGADLTLTWNRRTRLFENWLNGIMPLGEANESYSVDIFTDDTFSTVKRVVSSTSESIDYTGAQQIADFGAEQDVVYFAVYQISASVGRGYGTKFTSNIPVQNTPPTPIPNSPTVIANWMPVDLLPRAIYGHSSCNVSGGRTLVVGGQYQLGGTASGIFVDEAYFISVNEDDTLSFTTATQMPYSRAGHTAITLPDSRVFVVGGAARFTQAPTAETLIGTITGDIINWVVSTPMPVIPYSASACRLDDGRILVSGGIDLPASADRKADTWIGTITGDTVSWVSSTPLPAGRAGHTATLIEDGRILITGGSINSGINSDVTWLGTVTGSLISWAAATLLPYPPRTAHTVNAALGNNVVLIGGASSIGGGFTILNAVYIGKITGSVISWSEKASLLETSHSHTAAILRNGRVLLMGGSNGYSILDSTYLSLKE